MEVFPDWHWEPNVAERLAMTPIQGYWEMLLSSPGDPIRIERKYDGRRVFIVSTPVDDQFYSRNWKMIAASRFPDSVHRDIDAIRTNFAGPVSVLDCELMPDNQFYILDFARPDNQWSGPASIPTNALKHFRTPETISDPKFAKNPVIPSDWEGIVIKQRQLLISGKQRWIKWKHSFRVPCYVIGVARTGSMEHGAFLLATDEGGPLRYVGRVGTGFTSTERKELAELALAKEFPSVLIKTAGWTTNGRLREPVFCPGSIHVYSWPNP